MSGALVAPVEVTWPEGAGAVLVRVWQIHWRRRVALAVLVVGLAVGLVGAATMLLGRGDGDQVIADHLVGGDGGGDEGVLTPARWLPEWVLGWRGPAAS